MSFYDSVMNVLFFYMVSDVLQVMVVLFALPGACLFYSQFRIERKYFVRDVSVVLKFRDYMS